MPEFKLSDFISTKIISFRVFSSLSIFWLTFVSEQILTFHLNLFLIGKITGPESNLGNIKTIVGWYISNLFWYCKMEFTYEVLFDLPKSGGISLPFLLEFDSIIWFMLIIQIHFVSIFCTGFVSMFTIRFI